MSGLAEPLTITVEADTISVGDWVEPHGIAERVDDNGQIVVLFKNDCEIYSKGDKVTIRLEDHGESDVPETPDDSPETTDE